ncbi:MAG: indole acetimide hydrolase [Rhodocyclaceae bacterium]|nr:indole acetimide hydrolase [Rhodocyclaceae bacterium]
MTELWRKSATELAGMIASKAISSTEVVDAHLARIAAVNPSVNAVVRVLAEDARKASALADAMVARGDPLGPLHGVPFTVKENIDMAGLPTTWGVKALAQAIAPVDAPVVERMRAAGGIPIARTNLPDMGLRVHTDSSLHGLTRNPWNPGRTAGGSSGGEAVALATGMSPIGLGNDIGGSLRNPANACGIASIKPSAGRIADASVVPSQDRLLAVQMMQTQGPMARCVRDVRLGLEILIGAHPRDPMSFDMPLVGRKLGRPVRVAVVAAPPGGSCDPCISAVVRQAADALSNAGYDVVEVCPPRYEEAVAVWGQFLMGDFGAILPQLMPFMGADATALLNAFSAVTPPFANAAAMSHLLVARDGIAREWSQFLAVHPLILSPTWTQLPFAHGFDIATPEGTAETMAMIRPVVPTNLLGLPSACVPAGRDNATGLPIGVLIGGQRNREDLCLDAAEAIEARLGLVTPIDPVT